MDKLTFSLWSDVDRKVITKWGILNSHEREGIAYPNVYILDASGKVIFHSADKKASRVDVQPMLQFLEAHKKDKSLTLSNAHRTRVMPSFMDLLLYLPRKLGWLKA